MNYCYRYMCNAVKLRNITIENTSRIIKRITVNCQHGG